MRVSVFVRRITSWIACLAILMGSLAPVLTHAIERSPGHDWIEVCTTLGAQWIDTADDARQGATPEAPSEHAQQHCPCCASHAPTLGMPPASTVVLTMPRLRAGLPELFLQSPRTLHAWSTAQPRAPPAPLLSR